VRRARDLVFLPLNGVYPYPVRGVLAMALTVTAELALLLFVLRPTTYTHLSRRVFFALPVFAVLALGDFLFVSGMTDLPGFVYTNRYFLSRTLDFLLLLAAWWMVAATARAARRFLTNCEP
jgi:hypothetical protein